MISNKGSIFKNRLLCRWVQQINRKCFLLFPVVRAVQCWVRAESKLKIRIGADIHWITDIMPAQNCPLIDVSVCKSNTWMQTRSLFPDVEVSSVRRWVVCMYCDDVGYGNVMWIGYIQQQKYIPWHYWRLDIHCTSYRRKRRLPCRPT